MQLDQLIVRWREEGKRMSDMTRITKSVLKSVNIPADSKRFLNEAGLMDEIFLSGTIRRTLPRFSEAYPEISSLPSPSRCRVLGHTCMGVIQCLDEANGGAIVHVSFNEEDEEVAVIFVNSSIQQFAECRLAWEDIWTEMKRTKPLFNSKQEQMYVTRFEQEIRSIDPATLDNPQNQLSRDIARLRMGDPY